MYHMTAYALYHGWPVDFDVGNRVKIGHSTGVIDEFIDGEPKKLMCMVKLDDPKYGGLRVCILTSFLEKIDPVG